MDLDRFSHGCQPHSLLQNAMQSENYEWSVTRIEVESFHFVCELGYCQTRGRGISNQVWERVYSVLIVSKSAACCIDQLCDSTSRVHPLEYGKVCLMRRRASQSHRMTVWLRRQYLLLPQTTRIRVDSWVGLRRWCPWLRVITRVTCKEGGLVCNEGEHLHSQESHQHLVPLLVIVVKRACLLTTSDSVVIKQ